MFGLWEQVAIHSEKVATFFIISKYMSACSFSTAENAQKIYNLRFYDSLSKMSCITDPKIIFCICVEYFEKYI